MELLKKLTQINSVSGNEGAICELIKKETEPYADDVRIDALGNLIVHKKGNGKKIMYAAHMDEIGVIATFIDDNGFVRFGAVGGLNVRDLVYNRVVFSNGTVGVIGSEEENFKKTASVSKLYIDIGAANRDEAEKMVSVGDTAVFEGDMHIVGNRVISKALDNRVGCYVLIETLKRINSSVNDLYFVFTVQEEVGLRGARTAAYGVAPDMAVAVDVTDTGDVPECERMAVKLGKGAAVKIKDSSVLCHSDVRTLLIETAKENNIAYQLEILNAGGTDAGAIHTTREGVPTGGLSIPTRYIHSPSETADMGDIKACIDLLAAVSEKKL